MIKRGGSRLGYFTCYLDTLRSPGKSPLWWISSITKTREVLTKVAVGGSSIVTQDLGTCGGALHKYKSCDNSSYYTFGYNTLNVLKLLLWLGIGRGSTQTQLKIGLIWILRFSLLKNTWNIKILMKKYILKIPNH